MNAFERNLSSALARIYRSMEILEAKMLQDSNTVPLRFAEVRTLEAIARGGENEMATISEISDYLEIRLPTATTAVNRLERKGFAVREKCTQDKRVVRVRLTPAGKRVESLRKFFHRNMVRAALKDLSPQERYAMLKGIHKLSNFLDTQIRRYDAPLAT